MKKPVLLLLGIAIGVGVSYFYFNRQEATTTSEEATTVKEEATMARAIVKPKGVITPAQARALNNNWTDTRKQAVDSVAGRPDNRSSWWSLEDIENYLAYAKSQADTLGYTLDGIRIYQGVYAGNAPNGKADYATVFWVPTGKKSKSEGSFINIALYDDHDIPEGDPLNAGSTGRPPGSGY